jgi:heptosyltransferase-2
MGKKILLIELAGIGDVVLSSPVIKNLRSRDADSSIYFLAYSGPAEILKKSPYLDRIFIFHKVLKGTLSNIYVIKKLRNLEIDIAVNLYQHYTLGGAINMESLLKSIRPKRTLGRNTDGKGFFYDIKIEDTIITTRHDVEYKLDLIRALDCNIDDKKLEVWVDDSDMVKVKEFLQRHSISDSDLLIGINPGSHRPAHRWDWENFAKTAGELAKIYKAKIIITGTKAELGLARKISLKMSVKPVVSAGLLTLGQLVALIRRCNLYISNDTGPMHIANALGTPLIAIIGPGTMKTAPYQKDNCIILKKDVECSPCYKFRCKDTKCLNMITVDEALGACKKLLGG